MFARASQSLEDTFHPSPERAREVLDARARRLAQAPNASPQAALTIEAVTFTLGRERFALETRYVKEIIRPPALTAVPGTPSYVRGVANYRGEILLVLGLGNLLGQDTGQVTDAARVLVLGTDRAELGALVDRLDSIVSLSKAQLATPPAAAAGIRQELLRGIASDAMVVLAGDVLLAGVGLRSEPADRANFNLLFESDGGNGG